MRRSAARAAFLLLAASWAGLAFAGTSDVAGVEGRLAELSVRLRAMNAKLDRPDVALEFIAVLDHALPGSKEAAAAEVKARDFLKEQRAAVPIILEMSILSRRLQSYKETGVLPAAIPEADAIKRLLERPWEEHRDVEPLERELPALIRQLRRYEELSRRVPTAEFVRRPASEPRLRGESLARSSSTLADFPPSPAGVRAPAREDSVPALMRDEGKGRAETDPIPALIALLSSAEPRGRALAADELGQRGAAAASAVPALRAALADPDARVRASAALALGGVGAGSAEVVDDLRRALADPSEDVRFSARTALKRLGRGVRDR